jgi:hypothetical protein
MHFTVDCLEAAPITICFSPVKDHEAPCWLKEIFDGRLLLRWLGRLLRLSFLGRGAWI